MTTLSSAGTANAVQTALGITQAQVTTFLASGPPFSISNYPVSLEHGPEENWPTHGLVVQMQTIFNQVGYAYRV